MLDLKAQNESDSASEASLTSAPKMQRMVGRGFASVQETSGRIRLKDLHQSGSAKVFLPAVHAPTPEIVYLNTAGGVTGGDHISYGVDVGDNARATATTQTAERAYESSGGTGRVDVNLKVGSGARLDWLPQETILFQGSNMTRRTQVELAADAAFLMVETIVLGRAAMGETLTQAVFSDWREVRRAGKVKWVEPFAFDDRVLAARESVVTLAQARAFATVAFFDNAAQDAVGPLRAAIENCSDVVAAVSGWNGKVIIRLRAQDGWPLHRAVARVLNVLRADPLPRVWQK